MNFHPPPRELQKALYRLYRDFFRQAEHDRRWTIAGDIPWEQCRREFDSQLAEVVETLAAGQLIVPDYLIHSLRQLRRCRGLAWYFTRWGYDELKHGLVLTDWLLTSGQRDAEQVARLEQRVLQRSFHPPCEDALGTLCYTLLRSCSAEVVYENLLAGVRRAGGEPALEAGLERIVADAAAHVEFLRRAVQLTLPLDAPAATDRFHQIIETFHLPAVFDDVEQAQRWQMLAELRIFQRERDYPAVCRAAVQEME